MLDITTIVLTLNEGIHIKRCLDNLMLFSKIVYVVDCGSSDETCEICSRYSNVILVEHEWLGNQALQFNWALDNLSFESEWILRLDADEYLTPELIGELYEKLPSIPEHFSACVFPLGRAFGGRILKHGIVNSISMIRLFRVGLARYENILMDEHLRVFRGDIFIFDNKFIDDNLLPINKFIDKHNSYSTREAILLLDKEYDLIESYPFSTKAYYASSVEKKQGQKSLYARLPLFHRAIWYFFYRHIIRLGFLDGKEGFEWDFFQGLWYRLLVDAKIFEIKKACGDNRDKILDYIDKKYGIHLSNTTITNQ